MLNSTSLVKEFKTKIDKKPPENNIRQVLDKLEQFDHQPDEQPKEPSENPPFQIRKSEIIKSEKLGPIISEERLW